MSLASIVCFGIFTFLFISLFLKGVDIFSPARIFGMIWSIAVGLAELKLSRFQQEWSSYSWIVLTIALTSFIIGVFTIYSVNSHKKIYSIKEIRSHFSQISINTTFLFYIIITIFILYSLGYIVNTIAMGYIPVFAILPSESRVGWGIFGFGLLTHMSPPILAFSILYLIYEKKNKFKKMIVVLIILMTSITFLFLLQRFDLVVGLFLVMVLLFYSTNKLKIKNVMIFFLIVIALMYGVSSFRTSKSIANIVYYVSNMKYSIKYAYFTEPYMYLSMNIENFMNAVNKLDQFTYGYFTFDFILALSGLKHWIADYTYIPEFPYLITNSYNTYTAFFAYYRDFGVAGVAVIPFLIGSIASAIYYNIRMNPSIVNILSYGMFCFAIIFSFFIPMLSWLHFVFNFAIIFFASKLIMSKSAYR